MEFWSFVGIFVVSVVGFIFGFGTGHVRATDEAVQRGHIDRRGTRYRVEAASTTREAEADEINNAVRAAMRAGAYDADIAKINKRNEQRRRI